MSSISVHSLSVEIAGKMVCRDLDLSFAAGQCWAILGTNGVGKTTLLHTLAGLRAPAAGEPRLDDQSMQLLSRRHIAQNIGVLFQHESTLFPASVLETALIGRHPYLHAWQWEEAEDIERARRALSAMELDDLETRLTSTLSGGELRRLSIATLLTQDPRFYLLDEPANHLDPRHQIMVLEAVRKAVREEGKCALLVLHDANLAARYCDHALLLYGDGRCESGPAAEVINADNLSRMYGHPMLEAEFEGRRGFIAA